VVSGDSSQRLAHGGHVGGTKGALGVERSVAGGCEKVIAGAQRRLERLAQADHHSPAWPGAPRLEETQMPLGDARIGRETELARAPRGTPAGEAGSKRASGQLGRLRVHGSGT